jgi:hypothetical protein
MGRKEVRVDFNQLPPINLRGTIMGRKGEKEGGKG